MIEKRTMWLVESSLELHQVVVLYDIDKKEIVCEHYCAEGDEEEDEDWYHVCDGEMYFNTESEAKEARQRKIEELKEKMKTCKAIIQELDLVEPSDDFQFKREDYLWKYAHEVSESEYWRNRRENAEKEATLFNSIARTRHFNVAGQTIDIDEVVRVMWHKEDTATLVMRDGTRVKTYTKPEYEVVVGMFGSNRSGRCFPESYT